MSIFHFLKNGGIAMTIQEKNFLAEEILRQSPFYRDNEAGAKEDLISSMNRSIEEWDEIMKASNKRINNFVCRN
ncbi:hypothetical protein ACFL05_00640 [Patescibacteria group bacterium]